MLPPKTETWLRYVLQLKLAFVHFLLRFYIPCGTNGIAEGFLSVVLEQLPRHEFHRGLQQDMKFYTLICFFLCLTKLYIFLVGIFGSLFVCVCSSQKLLACQDLLTVH